MHNKSFGVELAFHELSNVLHGECVNVLGWSLLSHQGAKELVCSGCLVGQENLSSLFLWNGVGSEEHVKPGLVILPKFQSRVEQSKAGDTRCWGNWSRAARCQTIDQRLHLLTVPPLLHLDLLMLHLHLFLHQLD